MHASDPWRGLDDELDRWASDGLTARLWLRDDDAIEPTLALDRLLELTGRHGVPVLLAVIPSEAGSSLARRLEQIDGVSPCQHGCAHRNHAAPDQKKEELGSHRPLSTVLDDLTVARDRLADLFGSVVLPVLVPPWNRIATAVEAELPRLGFEALSAFGRKPAAGLARRIDCDLDIIDWKTNRGGRDPATLVPTLTQLLAAARREGGRAVGILAHHLVHDDIAWGFLTDLLARTRAHTAVRWVSFEALSKP